MVDTEAYWIDVGARECRRLQLILPVYQTLASGALTLAEGHLTVVHNQKLMKGHGHALLCLDRRISLLVQGTLELPDAFSLFGRDAPLELRFGNDTVRVRAHLTSLSSGSSEEHARVVLQPNPQRMVANIGGVTEVDYLVFHVVNFPQFVSLGHGGSDLRHDGRILGCVKLQSDGWHIEIQELPETNALTERLQVSGGYGITHVGRLSRQDAKPFPIPDAETLLQNLYLYLSFARGAWASPMLAVGFRGAGVKVYEDWGVRITTPWEGRVSWFDIHHGEALSALYPGFLTLLHSGELGKAVKSALYWYLRSNRGGEGAGIDSGIILSQAALERISSAYLDANGYVPPIKDNTANRLREALDRLQVPSEIPSSTPALIDGQRRGLWRDGPEAITRIRNELVHPRNKLPIKLGTVIPDTWRLAQWYAELLILRLAGYDGSYSNRLNAKWVGEVEEVPWRSRS